MRRRVAYVLPDRPWWEDLASSFALAIVAVVAMMVAGVLFAGCGDNVDCQSAEAPRPCTPAAGAALNLCGYTADVGGLSYQVAGCVHFLEPEGCTVPVNLARPDAAGRTLVDAICVPRCEAAP